jgi:multidrug efflux system membrane fusion protein
VNVGNIVHATDTTGIAVITQLQPIAVVFSIPEDQIPQVMVHSRTAPRIPVEAYDRANVNEIAKGKLLAIDSEVDSTTGMVKLKATFDNKDYGLFPGQFVNAHLLVDTLKKAVLVPAGAVQQGPDSTFVYVVKKDNTVEVRNVTPGPTAGDIVSITKGLNVRRSRRDRWRGQTDRRSEGGSAGADESAHNRAIDSAIAEIC